MTYKLKFLPSALKEWNKLSRPLQKQFKKKLAERLENPVIPDSALSGFKNHFKIKLRAAGYRLVYEVQDDVCVVLVIAIGPRSKNWIYKTAKKRS